MSTTQMIARLLDADGQPAVGYRVLCSLVGATGPGWLADHTAGVIDSAVAMPGATGLITFTLTPQTLLAAGGIYYRLTGRGINWAVVVPVSASPVQIRDCLVDPTTLTAYPDGGRRRDHVVDRSRPIWFRLVVGAAGSGSSAAR